MGNVKFEAADHAGIWIAQADSEGPTVAILGGVHADERTGIAVVEQSLDTLNIETGTVMLILGNLAAMSLDKPQRYIDVNLNRSFRSLTAEEKITDPEDLPYEVARGQELRLYLDEAEAALDLHDFTNPCTPFIITERNGLATAKAIGAPLISFGWSATEPGGSDGYMFEQGKIGICYELGQKDKPAQNLKRGHGAVARFLIAEGLVDGKLQPMYRKPLLVQTKEATLRTGSYEWGQEFSNFEELQTGQLIMNHAGEEIRAQEGDVIIFPTKQPRMGEEMFTLGYRVAE